MKLRPLLLLIFTVVLFFSCKKIDVPADSSKTLELSDLGSVNMIKEIGGDIFVLNSTASAIFRLNEDSLSLFRDLEIGGRDFLLDFDIEGDKVYYSNTYDEIFVSSGSSIEDTIKIFNPDRIAVIGSKLFVTSRKPEDGKILLKLIDIKSKSETGCIPLNDTLITEMKFAQVSIAETADGLRVNNPFRNKLELYDNTLNVISSIDIPRGYEYGNFSISDDEVKMISSKEDEIFLYSVKNSSHEFLPIKNIDSGSIDIRSSCVTESKILLYNFINSSIIINLTK